MLPASLFFTLHVLAHTAVGVAVHAHQEEAAECAGPDEPVPDTVQDRVAMELLAVNDRVQTSRVPGQHDHAPASQVPAQHDHARPDQVSAHVRVHVHDHAHAYPQVNLTTHGSATDGAVNLTGQGNHGSSGPGHATNTTVTNSTSEAAGKPSDESTPSSKIALVRPSDSPAPAGNPTQPSRNGTQSRNSILYFTNWNVREADFDPGIVEARGITHAIYAFADIDPDGTVKPGNPWADTEQRWKGDSTEVGNNAYGCVKRMYLLKKRNRHLKTLLSVGGFTASGAGKFNMAATEQGRKVFCKSAVKQVTDWGMDGLDVDWEYPKDVSEARYLVQFLGNCRDEFNAYADKHNQTRNRYLLTAATPAGPAHYRAMDLAGMDQYLDLWNVMTYDYAGTGGGATGHQANLFMDLDVPSSTEVCTNQTVYDYMTAGISPAKINVGLPLYGRSFAKTSGLGAPHQGNAILPYRDLPQPGAEVKFNEKVVAAWSYSEDNKELVTYDTVRSTQAKARYILDQNLGGAFFWEASQDKTDDDSLVSTMSAALSSRSHTENTFDYPDSPYDNIRNGIPGA